MSRTSSQYPVIDIFAGPGGLGEGFASCKNQHEQPRFRSLVSIERDEWAHKTLLLRHFLRAFRSGEAPEEYYDYLAGQITSDDLYDAYPNEHEHARQSALQISLGPDSHRLVRKVISERLGETSKWALVGGPPCQAYSLVGRSRMMGDPEFSKDERHFLYREYLKIISDHRPPIFVMENVKGLLSAKVENEPVINRIIADLSSPEAAIHNGRGNLTYNLYSLSEDEAPGKSADPSLFIVRAERFGVPQARHRMFIVGVRSDIKIKPKRLKPHKAPTVRQVIGQLPKIRSSLSRRDDVQSAWEAEVEKLDSKGLARSLSGTPYKRRIARTIRSHISAADWPLHTNSKRYPASPLIRYKVLTGLWDGRLKSLSSHDARSHMASDLRRYLFASAFAEATGRSPILSDFPRFLLPKHENVEQGREGGMFSDRFRVQLPNAVSTTVTSHISKDGHYFIHYDPSQCRSLTVREAARLQTFPDNYKFEGNRTSQYHQVGNAVPPYLAAQIAEIVAEVLDAAKGVAGG